MTSQSNDYTYYDGYEGEPEIIIRFDGIKALHLWDGYFDDIYCTPPLDGKGWKGFTRDYHQQEGIFASGAGVLMIDPTVYLEDLLQYRDKQFRFEETKAVFNLLVSLFKEAIKQHADISAELS